MVVKEKPHVRHTTRSAASLRAVTTLPPPSRRGERQEQRRPRWRTVPAGRRLRRRRAASSSEGQRDEKAEAETKEQASENGVAVPGLHRKSRGSRPRSNA